MDRDEEIRKTGDWDADDNFGGLPRLDIRPEDIWDLHHDLGWGTSRIARYLGLSRGGLRRVMREHGIPIRSRRERRTPWSLAVARGEISHPEDPASFWLCRRSSRAGIGCLLCPAKDQLPEECNEDCANCPPERAWRCPCANDAFHRPRWNRSKRA